MESIRTAKLSGFHICIETTIFPDSDQSALHNLANFIGKLDVDGWIHKRPASAANDATSTRASQSARNLIPNHYWRTFSALLDSTPQSNLEKKCIARPVAERVEKVSTGGHREIHDEGLRAL
jgi:hypothetical protein